MTKYFVGLDIHKDEIQGCVLDKEGDVVCKQRFLNTPQALDYFLEKQDKETSFVMEACGMYEPIYDRLEEQGYKVVLAHPYKVKAIAYSKKKTDEIDAKILADLLRANLIPESYVPSKQIRFRRTLVRNRTYLVRQRTNLKNRVHSILLKNGVRRIHTDIFGKGGLEWLAKIDLPYADRFMLDNLLSIVYNFNNKIDLTSEAINAIVKNDKQVNRLTKIPGIGNYLALLITSEIDDVKRFNTAKKVCGYIGIVPSVNQSGNNTRLGNITKLGSGLVRWGLIEAANRAIVSDKHFKERFEKLHKRIGRQKALVAIARKMITYIYIMLTNNIDYEALIVNK
jgi:transposase